MDVHNQWMFRYSDIMASLVDFQIDAQNSYLFIYIIYILKSSTCFEPYPAHLQEVYVVIVYICSLWYRHSVKSELSKITVLHFAALLISEN